LVVVELSLLCDDRMSAALRKSIKGEGSDGDDGFCKPVITSFCSDAPLLCSYKYAIPEDGACAPVYGE
jgi:hypothetical protein